jgi:hypothetical protein
MTLELILSLLSGVSGLFSKYIGTNGENLIQTGLQALGTLIASWVKRSPVSDISAALTALQTVLTALETDESTDPANLPQITELVKIVQAGIVGYQAAADGNDPGTLPIPPAVS